MCVCARVCGPAFAVGATRTDATRAAALFQLPHLRSKRSGGPQAPRGNVRGQAGHQAEEDGGVGDGPDLLLRARRGRGSVAQARRQVGEAPDDEERLAGGEEGVLTRKYTTTVATVATARMSRRVRGSSRPSSSRSDPTAPTCAAMASSMVVTAGTDSSWCTCTHWVPGRNGGGRSQLTLGRMSRRRRPCPRRATHNLAPFERDEAQDEDGHGGHGVLQEHEVGQRERVLLLGQLPHQARHAEVCVCACTRGAEAPFGSAELMCPKVQVRPRRSTRRPDL